jgi:hypothetical protein
MIIMPTVDNYNSLQEPDSYICELYSARLNVIAPKRISTSRTISGGSAITVRPGTISGLQETFRLRIDKENYEALLKIHTSTLNTWLIRSAAKGYLATINLVRAVEESGGKHYNIVLELTIIGEV